MLDSQNGQPGKEEREGSRERSGDYWWSWRGSNPRPHDCQSQPAYKLGSGNTGLFPV